MMTLYKFLNMVAVAMVLLPDLKMTETIGGRCLPPGLYEGFEAADVVLHATVLDR